MATDTRAPLGATALFRAVGLMADGPVSWGNPVRSGRPGVYVVELPAPLAAAPIEVIRVGKWVERVPSLRLDGHRPTTKELAARLSSFWLPDQTVLYVGMTTLSIGGRVAAFYRTALGDRRPHAGGHWLKTLGVLERAKVWWAETDAPEEYEDALLTAFADAVPEATRARLGDTSVILPFGNLQTATGDRKAHGISGALLADSPEATVTSALPGPAGAPRSGAPRPRRAPAPRAPSSPGTRSRRAQAPPTAAERRAGEPIHVSADGLDKLRAELTELRNVRRQVVIARVASARELGDLSENAEYHAAREELGFLEGRVRDLEDRLRRAVVITGPSHGAADMGSTVVVEIDEDRHTFALVGSAEANPAAGRISTSSPVGRALVGKREGEEVVVRTPAGEVHYRIIEVR
jgi:transcription elongation factor GreA